MMSIEGKVVAITGCSSGSDSSGLLIRAYASGTRPDWLPWSIVSARTCARVVAGSRESSEDHSGCKDARAAHAPELSE